MFGRNMNKPKNLPGTHAPFAIFINIVINCVLAFLDVLWKN